MGSRECLRDNQVAFGRSEGFEEGNSVLQGRLVRERIRIACRLELVIYSEQQEEHQAATKGNTVATYSKNSNISTNSGKKQKQKEHSSNSRSSSRSSSSMDFLDLIFERSDDDFDADVVVDQKTGALRKKSRDKLEHCVKNQEAAGVTDHATTGTKASTSNTFVPVTPTTPTTPTTIYTASILPAATSSTAPTSPSIGFSESSETVSPDEHGGITSDTATLRGITVSPDEHRGITSAPVEESQVIQLHLPATLGAFGDGTHPTTRLVCLEFFDFIGSILKGIFEKYPSKLMG